MLTENTELVDDRSNVTSRKEICSTCENFTVLKTCSKCGCIMPLKWKLKFAECPLKKW